MSPLSAASGFVQGASAGVALRADGGIEALPGLAGHPPLAADSPALTFARVARRAGPEGEPGTVVGGRRGHQVCGRPAGRFGWGSKQSGGQGSGRPNPAGRNTGQTEPCGRSVADAGRVLGLPAGGHVDGQEQHDRTALPGLRAHRAELDVDPAGHLRHQRRRR
jgi:hypothetical protein